MERIRLTMVNDKLKAFPSVSLPDGFRFTRYNPGDEIWWAKVEAAAGEFDSVESALRRFEEEFGPYKDQLQERCVFLEHETAGIIGTATAWYGNFRDEIIGRLHWVAIHPDFQGKKLARPLIKEAMNILARYHRKSYLTTQTTSFKAIKIYLDLGFVPFETSERCKAGWRMLAELLNHPALADYKNDF